MDGIEFALHEHLPEFGWHFAECEKCGRGFYARRPRSVCEDVRIGCAPDYGFIGRRQRVRHREPHEVLAVVREGMAGRGFTEATVDDLVGSGGDTFFVIAGVQLFDAVLRGQAPPTREAFFVPQPSVRVKSLHKVGHRPGISSSFVNLCTEELDGSTDDYLRHLESWLEVFHSLGMDTDGLTLIVEPEVFRRGDFTYRTVNVNYYGFELGEAIMLSADSPECRVRTILDFGFGFERIVWAVNEADSYFSLIGPPRQALTGRARLIDFVRTMTLLTAADLRPANTGPGYVLRKLGKMAVAEGARDADLDVLIRHGYRYWEDFVPPRRALDDCAAEVNAELSRAANATLAGRLGLRGNRIDLNQPSDAFVVDLLRLHGIRHDRIREALTVGNDHDG